MSANAAAHSPTTASHSPTSATHDGASKASTNEKEARDVEVALTAEAANDKVLTPKVLLTLFAISILSLAVTLGATGPSGIVPYIVANVGGQVDATWIINTTNLLQAAAGPPIVYLTDIYGRKKILLIALIPGIIGPFVTARADGIAQVIGGQVLTGAALSTKPLCYAIASEIVPRRWRGMAQYWISLLSSLGGLIGAVAGPAMVSSFGPTGWRALFYLTGGLFAASAIGIALFYSPPSRQAHFGTTGFKLRDLDYVGWMLSIGGVTLFLLGITFGGNKYPWDNAKVLAPLIVGIFTIIAFGIWEWRFKTDGLMAHSLFKDRNFALCLFSIFVEALLLFAILSQYSQEVLRLFTNDPIGQAKRLMPFWITGLVATIPLGLVAHKVDPRPIMIAGYLLYLAAAIMLATVKPGNDAVAIAADAIAGLAFAPVLTLLIVVAQLCTPPLLIGTASALMSTARALGSAVGTAIFSAIYANKFMGGLPSAVIDAARANGVAISPPVIQAAGMSIATGNPGPLRGAVPGISPAALDAILSAGKSVVANSFKYVWISVCAFTAVAIVAVAAMKSVKPHLTNSIDAPIEAPFGEEPVIPSKAAMETPAVADSPVTEKAETHHA